MRLFFGSRYSSRRLSFVIIVIFLTPVAIDLLSDSRDKDRIVVDRGLIRNLSDVLLNNSRNNLVVSSLSSFNLSCSGVAWIEPQKEPTVQQYVCQVSYYCRKEWRISGNVCPCLPSTAKGTLPLNFDTLLSLTWSDVASRFPDVQDGGYWRPSFCAPRRRVSVIVPYRDRERHLRAFLAHYHEVFRGQLIEYRIFVIEQELPFIFNKAILMNVGFLESQKVFDADCILFIDVDTFVERGDNMVICGDRPIHWAGHVNRTRYDFIRSHFGASILMTSKQFIEVNGYSNVYWGWGGEDDDFLNRVTNFALSYDVGPRAISRFQLIEHERDVTFEHNSQRYGLSLYSSSHPYVHARDGLNTVRYKMLALKQLPLYTWIHVRIEKPDIKALPFSAYKTLATFAYKKKVERIAISSYKQVVGSCARKEDLAESPRHYKSVTTCQYLCDVKHNHQCIGFTYTNNRNTDSFCVLLKYECNVVNTTSSVIYINENHLNKFYFTR